VTSSSLHEVKRLIRERVWSALDVAGVVPDGTARGRIPDFVGAEEAARRLADVPQWDRSRVLKVVPDRPQRHVRRRALAEGKLVYLAVPRLAAEQPFVELDPATLLVSFDEAAVPSVTLDIGRPVAPEQMRPVDLVVLGSVAANAKGQRIGKGAGYADLELALLGDAGLLGAHTTVVTTVHDRQVLEQTWPEAPHDGRVDLIVTPTRTIPCHHQHRTPTIRWADVSEHQVKAIPVLARLRDLTPFGTL
jgi:5-formyltetrahydrofolate cyclo-ligase